MESIQRLKELLAEARRQGDDIQVANLSYQAGDLYLEKGKWDLAHPLLDESYELCLRHGNPLGTALVAISLATLFLRTDRPAEAEPLARQAQAFFRENRDIHRTASSSLLLGDTLWAQKRPGEALSAYQEALGICESHGDGLGTATLLDRIATMHRLLDQDDQALVHFQRALGHWHKLAVPDREALTLTHLGDIHGRKGEVSRAASFHEHALELYRNLKNHPATAATEAELGRLRERIERQGGE